MANDGSSRLKKLQEEAQDALDDSRLARRDEAEISRFQAFLNFWMLVFRSYVRNRCPLRASGLAYASLLAMVPMLAVVLSVSSSLLRRQGEEPIYRFIDTMVERLTPSVQGPMLPGFRGHSLSDAAVTNGLAGGEPGLDRMQYEDTRREVARQIHEFVGNIRSGTLGVTSMVALLFVAIGMLSRIEDTFNDIWGVARGRSWFTRIVQYWGAITLGPIVLAVTVTLTSGPYFQATRGFLEAFGSAGAWAVKAGMALLPYVIWSLAFAVFYQLMPNTRVRWRAALVGGVLGGCLWQLNSEFSVLYVSRVVTNSQIYGSLGMIPIFMIGLYFAWVILLFGAQVAYAYQNRRAYLQEKQAEGVHQRGREFVALRLMTQVAVRFQRNEKPGTLTELAEAVGVPTRLAVQLLQSLAGAGLVVEVNGGEVAYAPARPLSHITAHEVLLAIRAGQGIEPSTRADASRAAVREHFDRIAEAERGAGSLTLEALALQSTGSAERTV
ncbi:MAG TPA: YhjD/YihY/BrkB family envelope integrity protein [Verrucomicrobiota bacterium]|nr:YhjD/YihY/BrkB family envelope integrity protein [Verrucomicrobiota bacterium]HNU52362.1 YhjD/YihY/BrkB family envelope integrity protein [Verrucomicrobiota bacterium]